MAGRLRSFFDADWEIQLRFALKDADLNREVVDASMWSFPTNGFRQKPAVVHPYFPCHQIVSLHPVGVDSFWEVPVCGPVGRQLWKCDLT